MTMVNIMYLYKYIIKSKQIEMGIIIMFLKFPIILSSNSCFLHLLTPKLFPEAMPNIGNLTCIFAAILDTIAILY